jgi:ATP-dependent DNA helicase DinG
LSNSKTSTDSTTPNTTRSLPVIPEYFVGDPVEHVFGADGLLSKEFPGYEVRPGQIGMARAVYDALRGAKTLVVEGPTGTGKSLAYLVPATYLARQGGRVLVVTANIALQEQLVNKDLPLLSRLLPWRFTYALLKGKNNYICQDVLTQNRKAGFFRNRERSAEERAQHKQIVEWSEHTRMGDKSELDFEPSSFVWQDFSISADDCPGKSCEHYDQCYSIDARNRAHGAGVLVVNYHLYFSDIAATNSILPPYEYVIFDEAHKMADIAREFFGMRLTEAGIKHVTGKLALGKGIVQDAAREFFSYLANLRFSSQYERRLQEPVVGWETLQNELFNASDQYLAQAQMAKLAGKTKERTVFDARSAQCLSMAEKLERMATLRNSDEEAYFLNILPGDRVSLEAKPVRVDEKLEASVFSQKPAVVTSATLSSDGKGFAYIKNELGCRNALEYMAESPFNWREQALLIVDTGMPDPGEKRLAHRNVVAEQVVNVIELAQGRTLALFTSIESMKYSYEYAKSRVSKYRLMMQGEIPRMKLIQEFKEDTHSVLFGTESFWTGVDVPGESLSCVVMDKIPFPSPDDPVLSYLTELYPKDGFRCFILPRAMVALRQGFGRLIRAMTDKGVVVILDPRLGSKGYGKQFVGSLPNVEVGYDLVDILKILPNPDLQV